MKTVSFCIDFVFTFQEFKSTQQLLKGNKSVAEDTKKGKSYCAINKMMRSRFLIQFCLSLDSDNEMELDDEDSHGRGRKKGRQRADSKSLSEDKRTTRE